MNRDLFCKNQAVEHENLVVETDGTDFHGVDHVDDISVVASRWGDSQESLKVDSLTACPSFPALSLNCSVATTQASSRIGGSQHVSRPYHPPSGGPPAVASPPASPPPPPPDLSPSRSRNSQDKSILSSPTSSKLFTTFIMPAMDGQPGPPAEPQNGDHENHMHGSCKHNHLGETREEATQLWEFSRLSLFLSPSNLQNGKRKNCTSGNSSTRNGSAPPLRLPRPQRPQPLAFSQSPFLNRSEEAVAYGCKDRPEDGTAGDTYNSYHTHTQDYGSFSGYSCRSSSIGAHLDEPDEPSQGKEFNLFQIDKSDDEYEDQLLFSGKHYARRIGIDGDANDRQDLVAKPEVEDEREAITPSAPRTKAQGIESTGEIVEEWSQLDHTQQGLTVFRTLSFSQVS